MSRGETAASTITRAVLCERNLATVKNPTALAEVRALARRLSEVLSPLRGYLSIWEAARVAPRYVPGPERDISRGRFAPILSSSELQVGAEVPSDPPDVPQSTLLDSHSNLVCLDLGGRVEQIGFVNTSRTDEATLIRSIGLRSPIRHMLLLGAGCSVTSQVMSASHCVWQWKAHIYRSNHPEVNPLLLADVSLPHVRRQIQAWLDQRGGFPPDGDTSEYSFYAEACYQLPAERRLFFEGLIRGGQPSLGYRLLGLLLEHDHFQWIWTTNFDDLVEKGRPQGWSRPLRAVGMHDARVVGQFDSNGSANLVRLHGDYRFDPLRNTTDELRSLDESLRDELVKKCRQGPLVVLGYSGQDDSVMKALEKAYSEKGAQEAGLTWLGLRGHEPRERVTRLLEQARASGYASGFAETDGFDDFMSRLARYVLTSESTAHEVERLLQADGPKRGMLRLPDGCHPTSELIKSNSWPVNSPDSIYELPRGDLTWPALNELTDGNAKSIAAGLVKDKLVVLGQRSEIERLFGGRGQDPAPTKTPIAKSELFWEGGVILGVLRHALAHAICPPDMQVFQSRNKAVIYDPAEPLRSRAGVPYFKAAELRLAQKAGQLFLSLIPDRYLPDRDLGRDVVTATRAELLGRQWNKPFNDELNYWRTRLGLQHPKDSARFVFPTDTEGGFEFLIRPGPVLTQQFGDRAGKARAQDHFYRFKAFHVEEPRLRFGRGTDVHPLRGLVKFGPFDAESGLIQRPVDIGVVAPQGMTSKLLRLLGLLGRPHRQIETKAEYLMEYPGFASVFGQPLVVPQPGESSWIESAPGVDPRAAPETNLRRALASITSGIDRLVSSSSPDVVLVGIPSSWRDFDHIDEDSLYLDLHDQVKAYCAPKGVRTQFFREETLGKRQQGEILWWLALALYAKALRTPWLIDSADQDVAYVGLGHAIDRLNEQGPIVLGCSHVFQGTGVGMRFRLSRIEDPIIRDRKNVFLKQEDAFRVGIQTRQLFLDSLERLPKRVLLCKRTPFTSEEILGLRAGFEGIGAVDFLTLEEERAWRYLSSRGRAAAPFPISRGQTVLIDDETFFLWLHGSARLDPGKTYFQGKTRIPSPVRVRRYLGSTPIETLASDLLALSKMDWNNLDLYSKMPANLSTSQRIARVGKLLTRLHPESFDYRLFM
jgi:SIR2-like domain